MQHCYTWAPKNWCFWAVVLEKTLESPLDCMEIKPVNAKGNQSWIFIGILMLKLKCRYFGHLIQRTDFLGKTLILGMIEGRKKEKGTTEDEMVGWHHRLIWTWVWVDCRSWWWTGRPGVLQSMGSQSVRYDWAAELNWVGWSDRTVTVVPEVVEDKVGNANIDQTLKCFKSRWGMFTSLVS